MISDDAIRPSTGPNDEQPLPTTETGNTMTAIIEATGLRKTYGDTTAMDGIDLVAQSGCLTALLGPNGAGKTTFISAVATLVKPDSGTLLVGGIDAVAHPQRVRPILGLAGQYASVEPAMTGRENVQQIGRLFGLNRSDARSAADDVLAKLGLSDAADRLVRTYSGGMRRRLDLGASLVGNPRLLLLDEPTTGLDPGSRLELWEAIRQLVAGGTDVLLTTQYLEEADHLARDVIIIDHGKVIASGTPNELKSRSGRDVIEIHPARQEDLAAVAAIVQSVIDHDVHVEQESLEVTAAIDDAAQFAAIVRAVTDSGIDLDDIAKRRPTLDEVFLGMTGRPASETPTTEGAAA
jgi:daunorubicin resistance ABC transporter ATP-binding subunit